MRTGVKKQDKTTDISFNEASPIIEVRTHNTDLKKRLTEYSRNYPDLCKLTYEDAEIGYMEFQIVKPPSVLPSDCTVQRGTEKESKVCSKEI